MNEQDWMPSVRASWAARCSNLNLRPGTKGRERELAAFLQGALAAAIATGAMSEERAAMIGFLVIVGRGEEFLAIKAQQQQQPQPQEEPQNDR